MVTHPRRRGEAGFVDVGEKQASKESNLRRLGLERTGDGLRV